MEEFIVELEDQGQDLLRLVLNKDSIVIATEPSHIENYIGRNSQITIKSANNRC